MNTLIFHSAPMSCSANEIATKPGKIVLYIGTRAQDSISLIFSPDEAEAVADVLEYAVFKLRALKNDEVAA